MSLQAMLQFISVWINLAHSLSPNQWHTFADKQYLYHDECFTASKQNAEHICGIVHNADNVASMSTLPIRDFITNSLITDDPDDGNAQCHEAFDQRFVLLGGSLFGSDANKKTFNGGLWWNGDIYDPNVINWGTNEPNGGTNHHAMFLGTREHTIHDIGWNTFGGAVICERNTISERVPLCCACSNPTIQTGCRLDSECQQHVCSSDPKCCNIRWNSSCAYNATNVCAYATLSPTNNPTLSPMSTTSLPTTAPVTISPTSIQPTLFPTKSPVTSSPTTSLPTTVQPSELPTTSPSTSLPTTSLPTTIQTSAGPTASPTTTLPTTVQPSALPTMFPTNSPITWSPTTLLPTTIQPSISPTTSPITSLPTMFPTTPKPTDFPTKTESQEHKYDITTSNGGDLNPNNSESSIINEVDFQGQIGILIALLIVLVCYVVTIIIIIKKNREENKTLPNNTAVSVQKSESVFSMTQNQLGSMSQTGSVAPVQRPKLKLAINSNSFQINAFNDMDVDVIETELKKQIQVTTIITPRRPVLEQKHSGEMSVAIDTCNAEKIMKNIRKHNKNSTNLSVYKMEGIGNNEEEKEQQFIPKPSYLETTKGFIDNIDNIEHKYDEQKDDIYIAKPEHLQTTKGYIEKRKSMNNYVAKPKHLQTTKGNDYSDNIDRNNSVIVAYPNDNDIIARPTNTGGC